MIVTNHALAPLSTGNLAAGRPDLTRSLARLNASRGAASPPADDAGDPSANPQRDAQTRSLDDATDHIGLAMSYVQTQDAYLKKIAHALDRMSELAEAAAQDSIPSNAERALYQNEFSRLSRFISNAPAKEFNDISLFSGDGLPVTLDLQGTAQTLQGVTLGSAAYTDVVNATLDTVADARDALGKIKLAILQVARDRAAISVDQDKLGSTAELLTVSKENRAAASSRIQDADAAKAATESARRKILMQSGTAMLAQANATPGGALRLLQ